MSSFFRSTISSESLIEYRICRLRSRVASSCSCANTLCASKFLGLEMPILLEELPQTKISVVLSALNKNGRRRVIENNSSMVASCVRWKEGAMQNSGTRINIAQPSSCEPASSGGVRSCRNVRGCERCSMPPHTPESGRYSHIGLFMYLAITNNDIPALLIYSKITVRYSTTKSNLSYQDEQ